MLTTEMYLGQGLGNQLACYVTTRVIAHDQKYEFGIASRQRFKGSSFLRLDWGRSVAIGEGPEGGPPNRLPEGIEYYYSEQSLRHPDGSDIRGYDEYLPRVPDRTKIDGLMQGEEYIQHRRGEIASWLATAKPLRLQGHRRPICILSVRGGEYIYFPQLYLGRQYWLHAIEHVKSLFPDAHFVAVTDDVKSTKALLPEIQTIHGSIGEDFAYVQHADVLILSNSSFGWFPAWTNKDVRLVIAPKYWSRHNVDDGYWGMLTNLTSGWVYLDSAGKLMDHKSCAAEALRIHQDASFKVNQGNGVHLVVSAFANDLNWVPRYANEYEIRDQSHNKVLPPTIDPSRVQSVRHAGSNIRDILAWICDNYEKLPPVVAFLKGNVFPRHVGQEYFDQVMKKRQYVPIIQKKRHKPVWPMAYFGRDGMYYELNTSWYVEHHPYRYFASASDFLKFCFDSDRQFRYLPFAPGANYIVTADQITEYPHQFYANLLTFVSHKTGGIVCAEAHIIERSLHLMWFCNLKPAQVMLSPIDFRVWRTKSRSRSRLDVRCLSVVSKRTTATVSLIREVVESIRHHRRRLVVTTIRAVGNALLGRRLSKGLEFPASRISDRKFGL